MFAPPLPHGQRCEDCNVLLTPATAVFTPRAMPPLIILGADGPDDEDEPDDFDDLEDEETPVQAVSTEELAEFLEERAKAN